MTIDLIKCTRCGDLYPDTFFYKRKDGYRRCYCKYCDRELTKGYQKKNLVKHIQKDFQKQMKIVEVKKISKNTKKLIQKGDYFYWV